MILERNTMKTKYKPLVAIGFEVGLTGVLLLGSANSVAFADDTAPAPGATVPSEAAPIAGTPRLRYRIAVDQGKWDEIRGDWWRGLPDDVREGIQSELIDKLQKSGYFIVLEREDTAMAQMSQEDSIAAQKAQDVPANAAPVPPREHRTPAAFIITPTVEGFTETGGKSHGFSLGGITVGNSKTTDTLTLSIRISNAQTSEILDTQKSIGTSESKSSSLSVGNLYNNSDFAKSAAGAAVDAALDDAVSKIVARLSQEPWTALVAARDKSTNRIIINAGNLAGVQTGQTFDVWRAGGVVTDPDTGEIISKGDETKIGRITIVRVEENASYADIVSGTDFQPRDIVRLAN